MNRTLISALLAVTLTLGGSGAAVAQAPKPKPAQAQAVDPFDAAAAAYDRKDYATEASLIRPLAAQGNARAQYNLGLMHDTGQGVTQDYKEAARLYGLAAAQGAADAQVYLGFMYANGQGVIQDNVYAHMWLNIGASSGPADAVKAAAEIRDIVAGEMTAADISKAQGLARECVKKNFKAC